MTAILHIFEVKDGWKRSAEIAVTREVLASLKQNGGRFVQYSRRGFKLRFDLVDGIWRGDITPLTVSFTKDNAHPLYARARKYFKTILQGHPAQEARERKKLLGDGVPLIRVAA